MVYDLTVILGPTASGKTKFAVKMAAEIGGEIISADSRQVYRRMDIGTGKDLQEYLYDGVAVPYHLIDIVDAGTKYNLFEYKRDFINAYNDILSRDKKPILCGGTGLYIEAVTKGYDLPEVPPDKALREELELLSMEELITRLSDLKKLHNTTDIDNKKRAIRAIEIALHEQKLSKRAAFHAEGALDSVEGRGRFLSPLKCKFIGQSVERDERNRRIDARLKYRLENGLVEEVKSLIESGISPEVLIYYGLEYKFVTLFLIGQLSYAEMEKQLAIAIHQFAKRQMTWFRGMERRGIPVEWVAV